MIIHKTNNTTNEWVLKEIKDYFWSYATKDILWVAALSLLMAFSATNAMMDYIPPSTLGRLVATVFISSLFILFPASFLARYRKLVITIEEKWATEEEREVLRKDFSESVSVFDGAMRMGEKYSFMVKELRIVNTYDISFFSTKNTFVSRTPMQVYAAMDYGKEIAIYDYPDSSKAKKTANEWIAEANHVLDTKKSMDVKNIADEELKKAEIKGELDTTKKEIIWGVVFLSLMIGMTIGVSIYLLPFNDTDRSGYLAVVISGILYAAIIAIDLGKTYSEYQEIKEQLQE